jgi:hypothetical protein
VEQPAIAGRRFEGMPQRVAEVERDPSACGAALTLVRHDDFHFGPGGPLDEFCEGSGPEDRGVAAGDRRTIRSQ